MHQHINLLEGAKVRRTELIKCSFSEGLCPGYVCFSTHSTALPNPVLHSQPHRNSKKCQMSLCCHNSQVWALSTSTSLP